MKDIRVQISVVKQKSPKITTLTQRLQLLDITGPVLMNMHTLRSDLFTTSLNYSTHTHTILCQMLRSREFLLVRNVSHSGKYNEESKQRYSTGVAGDQRNISLLELFITLPCASTIIFMGGDGGKHTSTSLTHVFLENM